MRQALSQQLQTEAITHSFAFSLEISSDEKSNGLADSTTAGFGFFPRSLSFWEEGKSMFKKSTAWLADQFFSRQAIVSESHLPTQIANV